MPTYEYECVECGNRFDAFQNMSDDPLTECEHCKGPVKRLISGGSGIIFKGSGFYVTDNKGKSSTAGGSGSKEKDVNTDKKESKDSKTESGSGKSSDSGSEKNSGTKKETVAAK